MYQTKLEVVNGCIATLGEQPLNSLDDEHVYKQAALDYLEASNRRTQKPGLWFNSEFITLQPDATSKYISVPQDAIRIERLPLDVRRFAQRGRRLYNLADNSFMWDYPMQVALVRLIPFEDVPFDGQDAIALTAILRFQMVYDGDNARYQQIDRDRARATTEMRAQNIREMDPNLLDTLSVVQKKFSLSPMTSLRGTRRIFILPQR